MEGCWQGARYFAKEIVLWRRMAASVLNGGASVSRGKASVLGNRLAYLKGWAFVQREGGMDRVGSVTCETAPELDVGMRSRKPEIF